MSVCGSREVQADGSQAHVVLPEVRAQCRRRLKAPLMEALRALQAATAIEDGVVSPAQLGVDTVPSAQGSQRVNDAATLDKAPKKSSRSSRPSPRRAPPQGRRCRSEPRDSNAASSG
jgi:hypothetical protein